MNKLFTLAVGLALAAAGCKATLQTTTTPTAVSQGTVTVNADPANGGIVSGAGTYPIGTTITLRAFPNNGWSFAHWQDGEVSAIRTIRVASGTAAYAAGFKEVTTGTFTTLSSPPEGGTILGAGTYPVNQVITVTATPNPNWRFDHWHNGSTNSVTTFVVPSGTYLATAYFLTNAPIYGNLTVAAEPPAGGTVTGSGTYPAGQSVTMTATPTSSWSFLHWQDGNTLNPRVIAVPAGTVLMTATFMTNPPVYSTIMGTAVPPEGGYVSGSGGQYTVGQSVTLTAVPNFNWRFTNWLDGNTNATRTVTATAGTMTVTAYFAQHGTLILFSEPPNGGSTSGAGTYPTSQTVAISAIPASTNWHFLRWQDGNTNASRQVTVAPGAIVMAATFATNAPVMGTITCAANPPTGGSVMGCGTYTVGQKVTILAMPQPNWRFNHWQDGDTNMSRSLPVPTSGTPFTMTAHFVQYGTISLLAEPPQGGTITGAGSYPVGQIVTVTASPAPKWFFSQWQDGLATRVRQVTVGPGSLLLAGTFTTNAPPILEDQAK